MSFGIEQRRSRLAPILGRDSQQLSMQLILKLRPKSENGTTTIDQKLLRTRPGPPSRDETYSN